MVSSLAFDGMIDYVDFNGEYSLLGENDVISSFLSIGLSADAVSYYDYIVVCRVYAGFLIDDLNGLVFE